MKLTLTKTMMNDGAGDTDIRQSLAAVSKALSSPALKFNIQSFLWKIWLLAGGIINAEQ